MAQVSFSPDKVAPPIDQKLEEIGAQAIIASRPVRVRVQPDLYDADKRAYQSWTGLAWTLDLVDVEEGRRFREALSKFMAAFGGDAEQQGRLLLALEELR